MSEIREIKIRDYYCPLCDNKSKQQTNHISEIYSQCKRCGSSVLYCDEQEAKDILEKRFSCFAVFHYYRFDLSKEFAEYRALVYSLIDEYDYVKFDAIIESHFITECWEGQNNKQIKIYDKEQFDGQFVSSIGRIHNWFECVFPNKNIRCGYYLTFEEDK